MKKRALIAILAVLAAAAGGGGWYWRQYPAPPRLEIQKTALKRGDVRRSVSTSGAVRAVITVEVGSQVSGLISAVEADYSDRVAKDAVLARIESSSFESRVREAGAGVAVAESNIAIQEADLARTEANLRKADSDLRRTEALARQGNAAQATLESAQAAYDASAASLKMSRAQISNARATLLQRQAALDSAQIDLSRTVIRSPIEGVVIERAIEVGQAVSASLSAPRIFTVAQELSHIEIAAEVDEADIGQIAVGNKVSFSVAAYPDVSFSGEVGQIRLGAVTLQNVVTYKVIVEADNADGKLLPGMTATVDIVTGERPGALVVANEALRFQPRGPAEQLVRRPAGPSPAGAAPAAGAPPPVPQAQPGRAPAAPGEAGPAASPNAAAAALLRLVDALTRQLELTPQQVADIRRQIGELRIGNGGAGTGAQAAAARERLQGNFRRIVAAALTDEQRKKYDELQAAGPQRFGTVWVVAADGMLEPRRVALGLSDSTVTEIRGPNLSPGMEAATRVREIAR